MGDKITSNSSLALWTVLDMIGDCPEKLVWEQLSFYKGKLWILFICGEREGYRNMIVKLF